MALIAGGEPVSQTEIDYNPKRLIKELNRNWGLVDPLLEEFSLHEKLTGTSRGPGKYFHVKSNNPQDVRYYLYIGRVNSCRGGGCSIPSEEMFNVDSEYFDYFILYNADLSIQSVRVFNYQATHGQEIMIKGWLKQFEGYRGEKKLEVGNDIDAISGATVSVYSITDDVLERTRNLKNWHEGEQNRSQAKN